MLLFPAWTHHSYTIFLYIKYHTLNLSLSVVGACCPSGVRLYRVAGNSLRVYWRSAGSSHSYITEMFGSSNNYTCTPDLGENSCDVGDVQCGDVYNVVVAPLTPEGSKVLFCPRRLYSGITVGSDCDVWWGRTGKFRFETIFFWHLFKISIVNSDQCCFKGSTVLFFKNVLQGKLT